MRAQDSRPETPSTPTELSGRRVIFYVTTALDLEIVAWLERAASRTSFETPRTFSAFARRAISAYLAHIHGGGRLEREVFPDEPAVLKRFTWTPHALYAALMTHVKTLPPHPERPWQTTWPYTSRRSHAIRSALRWWLRRHP